MGSDSPISVDKRGRIMTKVSHICIRVKSLDESVKFYHEDLGMPIIKIMYREPKSRDAAHLGDATNDATIELHEVQKPEGEPSEIDNGMHHLCLWVDDLDSLHQELKTKGLATGKAPREGMHIGDIPVKVAFIKDPDGVLIELLQRL